MSTQDTPSTGAGTNIVDVIARGVRWPRPAAQRLADALLDALAETVRVRVAEATQATPESGSESAVTCEIVQEAPYDFAYCETHDSTFPLGGRCKFYGRTPEDVYYDEAQEQRGRAVVAEMARDEALQWLELLLDQEPCAFEAGTCTTHGPVAVLPKGVCHVGQARDLITRQH
ncbi:hypothetical protein [Nocardioides sp. Leaf285]|uniref:hypothetical protein n=1 Tax=Nocardioides sp. Leaf285 TaxID=1736322 RepID=UPI000702AC51|nr:hypothetical protein [Nocardioides sp. Leaf285]KQP63002.1 hypothetical protein ASF47_18495 [Nocardioides sp. Leaf285]